ncbi:hypothetical protein ACPW96_00755 [Micromonospora sp. DT81.3]|uniref:hypothetical protein n=1 Tax=Actinomycetes TaxID=1760 RepID=UPI003CF55D5B
MHTSKGFAARRGPAKLAAVAVAGSVLLALAGGASASAAEPITGEGTVTIAFTDEGATVSVITTNTSAVDAYASATIGAPDGEIFDFGPSEYAPGETRVFTAELPGYTCADLGRVTATAFGSDVPGDGTFEYTSGPVRFPDPRITVTGCDAPPPPPPVDPGTPPAPGAAPAAPVHPVAVAAPGTNKLPSSQTDGALVASSWPALTIAGIVGVMAVLLSAGLFQWARRN